MQTKILLFVLTVLLTQTAFADVFDGKRKGFILGLGAGFHSTGLDVTYKGRTASKSKTGLATSFKIGYGVDEQLAIYYVRNASWAYDSDVNYSDVLFSGGISGVGLNYYIEPSARSAYLIGALGFGDFSAPFESENDFPTYTGSAFMIGSGFEIKKHVQGEITWLKTNLSNSNSIFEVSTSSIQFTVNYLFY